MASVQKVQHMLSDVLSDVLSALDLHIGQAPDTETASVKQVRCTMFPQHLVNSVFDPLLVGCVAMS